MVGLLDSLSLRPGGMFIFQEYAGGPEVHLPSFTCCHCGTVVIKNPARERPRYTCKRCMALACDLPACASECRNLIEVDGPLAQRDVLQQPWFLRDHQGYPVDRVYLPDGREQLIRRADNGSTARAMARMSATERTFLLTCTHCFNGFELASGLPASQVTCGSCRRIVCPAEACRGACPHAPPPRRV